MITTALWLTLERAAGSKKLDFGFTLLVRIMWLYCIARSVKLCPHSFFQLIATGSIHLKSMLMKVHTLLEHFTADNISVELKFYSVTVDPDGSDEDHDGQPLLHLTESWSSTMVSPRPQQRQLAARLTQSRCNSRQTKSGRGGGQFENCLVNYCYTNVRLETENTPVAGVCVLKSDEFIMSDSRRQIDRYSIWRLIFYGVALLILLQK